MTHLLDSGPERVNDPWETAIDRIRAREVLGRLGEHHRAALTLRVARDAQRAKEFYEAVLQVPFAAGHTGAWRTDQTSPPLAVWPSGDEEPEVRLSYRVDDIAAAVERVRAAGGQAGSPGRKPYGLVAECADDQGATFNLWQPAD